MYLRRMNTKRRFLLTNDDGIEAKGLAALVQMMRPFGEIIVVAPKDPQSGMSGAVSIGQTLRLYPHSQEEGVRRYVCTGTPVDCVKIAMNQFFSDESPYALVSGINHGSNASAAVLYSGTLGAAAEGALYGIPSIGFSLTTLHNPDADFSASIHYGRLIMESFLQNLPVAGCYINVNIPELPIEQIKGIRLCRQGRGAWIKEYEQRTDPYGHPYYWLTGEYRNDEPLAPDADQNVLATQCISIVPHQVDTTCYPELERLRETWRLAAEN